MVVWFSSFVVLWFYGLVVLRFYGSMVYVIGFAGFMFSGFVSLWFMISRRCGFIVYTFMVLWFLGFLVSKKYNFSISCFQEDIDPISMILKIITRTFIIVRRASLEM